jgi:hypothetical protein
MLMEIELSDAELVRRIGAGEREAETELFHRMAPRIRQYTSAPGGSVECTVTAEDDILIAHPRCELE